MARKIIDIGEVGNDGTGDSIRDSFRKVNENFRELYSSLGLGERLTFIGLDDTPTTYAGQENAIVTVNQTTDGLKFKQILGGTGVNIDQTTNQNQITINSEFSDVAGDPAPNLGGPLNAFSGGIRYPIANLPDLTNVSETQSLLNQITNVHGTNADDPDRIGVNKGYVDTKISLGGVDGIDPVTGESDSAFGRMTGPLILSRSPNEEDDILYDGLIAATKDYVDNGGFASGVNLYVATTGDDERDDLGKEKQGRSLPFAFRSIEAACKRAEEILLESNLELGPYRKLLTFNNGRGICQLSDIETAPISGTGFAGEITMAVDTLSLNNIGTNYRVGDRITFPSGTGESAVIEVLATVSTPGAISAFKIISSGLYSVLPGSSDVATETDSEFGTGATFDITYKVADISVTDGGSGYSLVSARVEGGGGTGAFGEATVVGGVITNIEITDAGSGFTTFPTLVVNLPRLLIRTDGFQTDFTGDTDTDSVAAFRTRDIREGFLLEGVTSGAIAQILSHSGELDSFGNEIFDVDILSGTFEIGEEIRYGDRAQETQVCIFVEAGIYEEHFPLRVPPNTAIIGDEFRRTIVRPRQGTSSSPWAFQRFRRDLTIPEPDPVTDGDGLVTSGTDLVIGERLFGYHYLQDSAAPVYPKISNPGNYNEAATLLELNRKFLQEETIAWINEQIVEETAPFTSAFTYNSARCKKDVGLITDAVIFDLRYGEYNRTISAGLKYYETASGRIAITDQLSETLAAIDRWFELAGKVINNEEIFDTFSTESQVIDRAFQSAPEAPTVLEDLTDALKDVIDGSGSVNYPKENDAMDMFLMNDADILRAVTGQGHGGFMMVLDPTGQVLAKSPYCQESASFSKSTNEWTFAGGMFVDGFTGNLQFLHDSSDSTTRINVSGLDRFPQLPASFIVADTRFTINYVRNFQYNKDGSTATFVLDETTPFDLAPGPQTCTISQGSPAIITKNDHGLTPGVTLVFNATGGTLPAGIEEGVEYYVLSSNITPNTFQIEALPGTGQPIETTSAGSGTFDYQVKYEVLMPGNRSMLSNDYTQVNDMGFGLLATNGGLTESVSMFTYYNYVSYYAVNGAQIRSIGGSSAHGVYALVAAGSDPLEVPTPTEPYYDFAQRVDCFFPSAGFANEKEGLIVFVNNYDWAPLENGELEVDHGNFIVRYPVTSVNTEGLPDGVARLNLTSDTSGNFDGIFEVIPDGTKMTYRSKATFILTGGLENVAVRPSTGLVLNESPEVYRVLQFQAYSNDIDEEFITRIVTTGDPGELSIYVEVTDISTDSTRFILTTSYNHRLREGDTFVPTSSTNGFTAGTTYYVVEVPAYNQIIVDTDPQGNDGFSPSTGTSLSILGLVPHKLVPNFTIAFNTTGTLPTGLDNEVFFVLEEGLTDTKFQVSRERNGNPVAITDAGSGDLTYFQTGLTKTTTRENYNFNDLTLFQPNIEVPGTRTTVTISIAAPGVFTTSGAHGLNVGDAIRLFTTGDLPTGLSTAQNYFVNTTPSANTFTVSSGYPGISGTAVVDTTGTQSGTHSFSFVKGRPGDRSFAVVPVAPQDRDRIPGSRFTFRGEDYIIEEYQSEEETNEAYAILVLDRDLEDGLIYYSGSYAIQSAVPIRDQRAKGTLTVRISLVRVTSHDLLEIGTGSYADTNYPKEIYGASVNAFEEANEVIERDVGRVFFVTTDQFGNFKVGPFFKVDQGTGTVTFAAAIALSNLDGLGFKRGVPISEFSVDSTFTDNAVDTVPTENATRVYIERRLGISHSGAVVPEETLIPTGSGGFMSLDGQLSMKGNMNLGDNKIITVADPTNPQDAVNLRSLTFTNLQEFTGNSISANQLLVFTGDGNEAVNATIVGDIALDIDSTANTIDAQIVPDTIIDTDVKLPLNNTEFEAEAILQSKLNMNKASARTAAAAGTNQAIQATLGVASFDDTQFTVTDGFVELQTATDNTTGIELEKIQHFAGRHVIANPNVSVDGAQAVSYADVVNVGGALKKNQFTGTGFIRRDNTSSNANDVDYSIVESSAAYTGASDNNKLINRDSQGDFEARVGNLSKLKIDDLDAVDSVQTASGGYIQLYTYTGAGGIFLSGGSLGTDKVNQYRNDLHEFLTQDGSDDAPITAKSVQTLALTTGGNTTAGTVTGRWSLTGTSPTESRFEATYSADVAEYYEGDAEYEVGTVLVFGGDKEVTTTVRHADPRVAGVVSATAGFVMYTSCPGLKNCVALTGRVPCKVLGKINKGDIIVTSEVPGVGVKAIGDVRAGTIIGKAIENYDSTEVGLIEVAVGRT